MRPALAIAAVVLAGLATSCRESPAATAVATADLPDLPRTESASIALTNFEGRLRGTLRRLDGRFTPELAAAAIDLLLTRARFLGTMDDYATADELSARWVEVAPTAPEAHLARGEVLATLHRFDQARAALDRARAAGLGVGAGHGLEAALAEATGARDAARRLRREEAERRPGVFALGALAALAAEAGDHAAAERHFRAALVVDRGLSPFAVAWLAFQWGHARELAGDRAGARALYLAGHERLPAYVDLALHPAELELAAGELDAAFGRLAPLAQRSEHPGLLGALVNLSFLRADDAAAEGYQRRAGAARAALAVQHPAAFGGHAHDRGAALGLGGAVR